MTTTLDISPRQWAGALGVAVLVVTGASVGASLLSFMTVTDPLLMHARDTLVRLTWLDGEANIPAWFSSCLLLLAATPHERHLPAD